MHVRVHGPFACEFYVASFERFERHVKETMERQTHTLDWLRAFCQIHAGFWFTDACDERYILESEWDKGTRCVVHGHKDGCELTCKDQTETVTSLHGFLNRVRALHGIDAYISRSGD